MVDWMQMLTNYWWVLAIILTTVFVVMRIHHFFRFFTALVTLLIIFYVATIVFFPPSDNLPTSEISKVLGVSTGVSESSESSDSVESTGSGTLCSHTVDSREDLTDCVGEWGENFKMPDLKGVFSEYVKIKYDTSEDTRE